MAQKRPAMESGLITSPASHVPPDRRLEPQEPDEQVAYNIRGRIPNYQQETKRMNPYQSPDTVDTCRRDYWLAKRIGYAMACIAIVYGLVAVGTIWHEFRASVSIRNMRTVDQVRAFISDWNYNPEYDH